MKFTSFLIPIAVVAIGGAWIANQFRKHSDLQNEIARLQRRIKVTTPASLSPPAIRTHRTALEKDPVDWQQVALELGRNKGGPGIFKTTRRIEEQLRALSADELKTALKVIDEGSLDPRAKLGLTYRLLRLLLDVDPGYLITHRSSNPEVAAAWEKWQNDAMINWTRKEPAKAVAWFDAQPADAFSPERKKEFQLGIFNSLSASSISKKPRTGSAGTPKRNVEHSSRTFPPSVPPGPGPTSLTKILLPSMPRSPAYQKQTQKDFSPTRSWPFQNKIAPWASGRFKTTSRDGTP